MDPSSAPANPKAELVDKLKSANNILITVSRNPSVDQLASCIGLTLLLNKQGKHAAAVFSGEVPSTIEFLQPEETIEKNTDSLRDFIIALDKSKADKLRYKVEDQVVRIFITPYKTSISQDDLEFSQGDFNVDVVVALGVQSQDDLDDAITAHGRILHDATVATINDTDSGELGSINWNDPTASSLCELVTALAQTLGKDLIDQQIATALLTGIVAETNRFSNEKTTSATMNASATLMAAGANQQLVASRLDDQSGEAAVLPADSPSDLNSQGGGALEIDHETNDTEPSADDVLPAESNPAAELPPVPEAAPLDSLFPSTPAPDVANEPVEPTGNENLSPGSKLVTDPPSLGGTLTANSQPEGLDPTTDPLSLPVLEQNHLLDHQAPAAQTTPPPADPSTAPSLTLPSDNLPASVPVDTPSEPATPPALPFDTPTDNTPAAPISEPVSTVAPEPVPPPEPPAPVAAPEPIITGLTPPPPAWVPPNTDPFAENTSPSSEPPQTLADIETSVGSEHVVDEGTVDAARDAVTEALHGGTAPLEPVQSLNAQPMTGSLHDDTDVPTTSPSTPEPTPAPVDTTFDPTKFGVMNDPETPTAPAAEAPTVIDPTAPPPVPPPIPFQFGAPADPNGQSA